MFQSHGFCHSLISYRLSETVLLSLVFPVAWNCLDFTRKHSRHLFEGWRNLHHARPTVSRRASATEPFWRPGAGEFLGCTFSAATTKQCWSGLGGGKCCDGVGRNGTGWRPGRHVLLAAAGRRHACLSPPQANRCAAQCATLLLVLNSSLHPPAQTDKHYLQHANFRNWVQSASTSSTWVWPFRSPLRRNFVTLKTVSLLEFQVLTVASVYSGINSKVSK